MSDLIERDKAIAVIDRCKHRLQGQGSTYEIMLDMIKTIPSVDTPTTMTGVIDAIREAEYRGYMKAVKDRPKGEWIYCEDDEGQDGYRCSECGFFVPWYYDYEDSNYILDYKACPHCLARMKGADDEADNI